MSQSPSATFAWAFAIVVGTEGPWGNDPRDRGNWTGGARGVGLLKGTKYGISAASYPALDIQNLTLAQAQAIYWSDFWLKMGCDKMGAALALHVFDAGVNNGPGNAAHFLQVAVGVFADGSIGPKTLAATDAYVAAHGAPPLLAEFMARRIVFMAAEDDWPVNALGWARRLASMPYQAMEGPALSNG